MSFPVQPHSAEKVQHDINIVLEAISRFLSRIQPPELPKKARENGQVHDAEIIPDIEVLPSRDPASLEGNASHPQLEPEVRLQLGSSYIAVPLPQLRQNLERLPPEYLSTLAGAISSSALPPADHQDVIEAEVIDIEVDGVQCFHQEYGQITNNLLLPDSQTTTEINDQPVTELCPVGEVESLTGQEIGDLSALHNEVVHQAPSIRVERDQYGNIKGSTAIRAVVEPTEDKLEADAEYRVEHPLTPEAKLVVAQLHDYFERTGEKELAGRQDYDIQVDSDRILFIPKNSSAETVTVQGEQAISTSSARIEHLMVRFAAAYESLQAIEPSHDIELTR